METREEKNDDGIEKRSDSPQGPPLGDNGKLRRNTYDHPPPVKDQPKKPETKTK